MNGWVTVDGNLIHTDGSDIWENPDGSDMWDDDPNIEGNVTEAAWDDLINLVAHARIRATPDGNPCVWAAEIHGELNGGAWVQLVNEGSPVTSIRMPLKHAQNLVDRINGVWTDSTMATQWESMDDGTPNLTLDLPTTIYRTAARALRRRHREAMGALYRSALRGFQRWPD